MGKIALDVHYAVVEIGIKLTVHGGLFKLTPLLNIEYYLVLNLLRNCNTEIAQ